MKQDSQQTVDDRTPYAYWEKNRRGGLKTDRRGSHVVSVPYTSLQRGQNSFIIKLWLMEKRQVPNDKCTSVSN